MTGGRDAFGVSLARVYLGSVHLRLISVAVLVLAGVGCGPEQDRYDELIAMGADDDGEEDHNPGFPCVDCHGPVTGPSFELAGTIYRTSTPGTSGRRGQRRGDPGITVHVRDAAGREYQARTNEAGNFMLGDGDEGSVRVGQPLEFPLHVSIEADGITQEMLTPIHRERSCSSCHLCAPNDCAPSESLIGPVYLEDP